jgi:flagellar biosynthesis protein FlhB
VVIQGMIPVLLGAGRLPLSQLLSTASAGTTSVLRAGVVAGLLLSLMDVLVIMKRNRKKNRMTRYEVQQESKQTEGDPWVKGARRSKQIQMSRNRMIADVAQADVVLVNPTHVAVALSYQQGTGAPRVVAKGAGPTAARIRSLASEARVPLVEDVPLARSLYRACEIGQEIPPELFTAVARILAFVMRLRSRGQHAGMHRPAVSPSRSIPDGTTLRRRHRSR